MEVNDLAWNEPAGFQHTMANHWLLMWCPSENCNQDRTNPILPLFSPNTKAFAITKNLTTTCSAYELGRKKNIVYDHRSQFNRGATRGTILSHGESGLYTIIIADWGKESLRALLLVIGCMTLHTSQQGAKPRILRICQMKRRTQNQMLTRNTTLVPHSGLIGTNIAISRATQPCRSRSDENHFFVKQRSIHMVTYR